MVEYEMEVDLDKDFSTSELLNKLETLVEKIQVQKYELVSSNYQNMESTSTSFKSPIWNVFNDISKMEPCTDFDVAKDSCYENLNHSNRSLIENSSQQKVDDLIKIVSESNEGLVKINQLLLKLKEEKSIRKCIENFPAELLQTIKQTSEKSSNAHSEFSTILSHLSVLQTQSTFASNLLQRNHLLNINEAKVGLLPTDIYKLNQCEVSNPKKILNTVFTLCEDTDQKQIYEVLLPVDDHSVAVSKELWVTFNSKKSIRNKRKVEDVIIKNSDISFDDLKLHEYTEDDLPQLFAEIKSRLYLKIE